MKIVHNDGGRARAGFKGSTGDCVARAIAIVTGREYGEVYMRLAQGNALQRRSKRPSKGAGKFSAAHGINTGRKWFKDYMHELGFTWTPTMAIGSGCKVHLRKNELPAGRLVVAVSKHFTAVIDGVCHDTHDPTRGGFRCVYGYWSLDQKGGEQ